MRFKIDENLPVEAAYSLIAAGHDAATIHDEGLVGYPDPDVAAVCQSERRALRAFPFSKMSLMRRIVWSR